MGFRMSLREGNRTLAASLLGLRGDGEPQPGGEAALPGITHPLRPLAHTAGCCICVLCFLPAHSHAIWPLSLRGSYFLSQHMLTFYSTHPSEMLTSLFDICQNGFTSP